MKKYISVIIALVLSVALCFTGCNEIPVDTQKEDGINSQQSNNSEIKENLQEENDTKINIVTGINVCEYKDYIFYRNTNDNGCLYRYNIKNNSYTRLFDKNYNAFLHSISVYDEYVYFVTKTVTDTTATLYRMHIDGGDYERILENVGDDYVIIENAIYYTDMGTLSNHFALHKYTLTDKTDVVLQENENSYLILKDDKLFFTTVKYSLTGFEISLNLLNLADDSINEVPIGDISDIHYATSLNNCENIFFVAYYNKDKPRFACYNTKTGEIKILSEEFDGFTRMSVVSDNLVYFQARKNGVRNIYQYLDGKISLYTAIEAKGTHSIETVNGKPVLFSDSNSGKEKIIGDDRLNVVVKES